MDILSKDERIISDVINRILNCRKINRLNVFGKIGGELDYLYPAVNICFVNGPSDLTGDVVYIHIEKKEEFEKVMPWIMKYKKCKDFILYISHETEIPHEDLEILGTPHYLNRYSGLRGVLFLVGITFDIPLELTVPNNFKVLAIIHFYNEADIIEKTIQYLLEQEIDLYLLDNWSDDGSFDIAQKYQRAYSDRIKLEHYPLSGKSENYEWYSQLEKTELISKELDYDWFIHYDMDEMRISPWRDITLRRAIYWIDKQGYNCIENTVIDFRFTKCDTDNIFMKDTYFDFRHTKIWFDQLKTWKKSGYIELKSSGGHFAHVNNPRIYPLKFLNRHYPLRSIHQAEKKVFQDRIPRYRKEHSERGWHGHYDRFRKAEDFLFEPSQLLLWQENTFCELYIPLFFECGLRWDSDVTIKVIDLPDIEDRKVVLYGAGNIGKRVYLELRKKNHVVGWVDKNYEQLPVVFCENLESPQRIREMDFDYVIIAVRKKDLIEEITEELNNTYHVPEEKILFC